MKLKKSLALALCMALTITSAGCMKKLPASTDVNKAAASAKELVPEKGAALKFRTSDTAFGKAVAEKFKEKYGVTVTVESGGLYDTQKAALEGPSGKGPDIFMLPDDKSAEGILQGLFLPLDDSIVQYLNKNISSVAMKTVTSNNKVYGVPVSIETYVLFYNKKLVKGAPATTFEQLAEEAKAFNNPKKNKFYFVFDASTGSPIYTMLNTYGFNLFGPNGTDNDKPGFDTPEFEKGLEVLRKYKEIVPVSADDLGNTDMVKTNFINGNIAYILDGPWSLQAYRDAKMDIGVAPMVTYDGHQEKTFAFVQNAHVSAYTKYPNAAKLFAEFLVSDESAELLYTKSSRITSLKDISNVKGLADDEVLSTIIKAFNNAVPMPTVKRISYFWTIARDIGPAVFDGKMTPKQGAKKAQEEWKSFIETE